MTYDRRELRIENPHPMSGTRNRNFREGDRSEYLAVYLLSALGLVTEVPRQEDIGFDLLCNVAEQEHGILAFRHHYAVSVKSASSPVVLLEPPESKEKDANYADHYNWLFHLEIPLMLAVVDKKKQKLALYSTLPTWFIYYGLLPTCGIIELVPRIQVGKTNPDVTSPHNAGPQATAGGRNRYVVDLGYPIIELETSELENHALLQNKKIALRHAIELGTLTANYAALGVPFFWWFNMTLPGGYVVGKTDPDGFKGGMAYAIATPPTHQELEKMLRSLSPGLMSAALLFKANDPKLLSSVADLMRMLPDGSVPKEIREKLPEIYGGTSGPGANP